MKIIYLKKEKEIVFNEIVKNEDARDLKTKLMADSKYNGCKGYIVNLDAHEGIFAVNVAEVKETEEKPKSKKNG